MPRRRRPRPKSAKRRAREQELLDHSKQVLASCPLAVGPFTAEERRCDWCGGQLRGAQRRWCSKVCSFTYYINHRWTDARFEAFHRRDARTCVKCGERGHEVNHIEPCLGAHSVISCSHHQENLETLCSDCHKPITAQQAADRAAARRQEQESRC